jgi:hypothetical protein
MISRRCPPTAVLCVVLSAANAAVAVAQPNALPEARPIQLVTIEPLPHAQASFQVRGRELARYHFDRADRRPFLFPLVGPSGVSLTRMGHPHDPVTHSHHNSFWVAHNSVDGVSFWGDHGKNLGRIVPQRIERLDDGDDAAVLTTLNHWTSDADGAVLLVERRRIELRPLEQGEYLLVLDLELRAEKRPIALGKTPFGLVAVRLRKSIGVHDGGGRIRNSGGGLNEKGLDGADGVFWKPAKWCDYSGPVSSTVVEGITLFDHPTNPNHPTVFHVRDDGWMGSSLTFDADRTIEPAAPLRLRYAAYVHTGLPSPEAIDRRWQQFADLERPARLERRPVP